MLTVKNTLNNILASYTSSFFLRQRKKILYTYGRQNPKNIVEKECKDHLVPAPPPRAGTPFPRPGYSKSSLALNTSCNGESTPSLGNLYHCLHSKEFLLNIKEGKVITLVSSLHALVKSPSPFFM